MTITAFIITCIYFYLPAAFANIGANMGSFMPVFKNIKTPVDFGRSFNGTRIVGEHKIWGGLLFGIVFGSFMGFLKYVLFDRHMGQYLLLNLNLAENTALYTLLSASALLGDIIKSVLKRLFKIAPHAAWIPFDEIDHSTASLFIARIFFPIPFKFIVATITIYFFLHIASNVIGYKLKMKKVPY